MNVSTLGGAATRCIGYGHIGDGNLHLNVTTPKYSKVNIIIISNNNLCIPMTFNNPLKVGFSNKKYTLTTQKRPTQIVKVYFLFKNRVLSDF